MLGDGVGSEPMSTLARKDATTSEKREGVHGYRARISEAGNSAADAPTKTPTAPRGRRRHRGPACRMLGTRTSHATANCNRHAIRDSAGERAPERWPVRLSFAM